MVAKRNNQSGNFFFLHLRRSLALNPIGTRGGAPIFYLDFSAANSVQLFLLEKRCLVVRCFVNSSTSVLNSLNSCDFSMASTLTLGLGVATAAFLVREADDRQTDLEG